MDCVVHGVAKSRTRLSDFHSLTVSHSWGVERSRLKPVLCDSHIYALNPRAVLRSNLFYVSELPEYPA